MATTAQLVGGASARNAVPRPKPIQAHRIHQRFERDQRRGPVSSTEQVPGPLAARVPGLEGLAQSDRRALFAYARGPELAAHAPLTRAALLERMWQPRRAAFLAAVTGGAGAKELLAFVREPEAVSFVDSPEVYGGYNAIVFGEPRQVDAPSYAQVTLWSSSGAFPAVESPDAIADSGFVHPDTGSPLRCLVRRASVPRGDLFLLMQWLENSLLFDGARVFDRSTADDRRRFVHPFRLHEMALAVLHRLAAKRGGLSLSSEVL
jgi:hypothetical protein